MQTALESRKLNFGIGNLALIIVVAGILTFLAFRENPAKFKTENQTALLLPPISYETPKSNSSGTELAKLDGARVLGAATYNKDYVDQLDIHVKTLSTNTPEGIANYAQQINLIYDTDQVASGLKPQEQKFLNDISELGAPSSIIDYQKLLIRFYQLDLARQSGQVSAQEEMSQVAPQLDQIRNALQQAYGYVLP